MLTQYQEGTGEGITEIENKLKDDPNNPDLLDWLAFMYYSNNETEKAIATYVRALEVEPNNASQHYYLGNCYVKSGQAEKAVCEWRRVVALQPNKYVRKAQERIGKVGGDAS